MDHAASPLRTPLALCAAAALVFAGACGKGSSGVYGGPGAGPVPGSTGGPIGGQDGGTDAGADAGPDGGADAGDGGCAGSLARPIFVAFDHCAALPGRHGALLQDLSCSAQIILDTAVTCTGELFGDKNSFTGQCRGLTCKGASIPGEVRCEDGTDAGCAIDLCATLDDPLCL